MLKNQSNVMIHHTALLHHSLAMTREDHCNIELMKKVVDFIEQHPCKIKRIKIEGFV